MFPVPEKSKKDALDLLSENRVLIYPVCRIQHIPQPNMVFKFCTFANFHRKIRTGRPQITKAAIPQHKLQANKGSDKTFFFVSVS